MPKAREESRIFFQRWIFQYLRLFILSRTYFCHLLFPSLLPSSLLPFHPFFVSSFLALLWRAIPFHYSSDSLCIREQEWIHSLSMIPPVRGEAYFSHRWLQWPC
jgi:hypothetical protein